VVYQRKNLRVSREKKDWENTYSQNYYGQMLVGPRILILPCLQEIGSQKDLQEIMENWESQEPI
jgi:hypothetical protein